MPVAVAGATRSRMAAGRSQADRVRSVMRRPGSEDRDSGRPARGPRAGAAGSSSLREAARFAWQGVVANKARALLTMLGIVIGVASVITLVAVGTGSNQAVAASIARLGSNALNVSPMPTGTGGHGSGFQARLRKLLGIKTRADNGTHARGSVLSFADLAALQNSPAAPDVLQVAPKINVHDPVAQYGTSSHTVNGPFIGTTPDYLDIDNDTVSAGRTFTEVENAAHRRVALVGTSVAADLVPGDAADLLGRDVRFNGQAFTVIGILGTKGYSGQQDLDDTVIAPATAVQDSLYGYEPHSGTELSGIAVQATSSATIGLAQNEVQNILDEQHHVSAVDTDVIVYDATAVRSAFTQADHTLTILLGSVAGISLLVGGIGVMNIMLVSVTERTREIGIRKAIGAKRADIVGQFLTEAVMLSMLGGLIGMGIGFLCTRYTIAGVRPVIAPWSIWLALAVSLFTGLFFGAYPASRAASLNPIDALRYE
ncbi:MAG TPA: ABC transporter permease [Sporichthyaceae bacterium]|jgi:putative ABC transport system permease protein|nr:ABC transporter permease [Sporichthyaceae bacterium]